MCTCHIRGAVLFFSKPRLKILGGCTCPPCPPPSTRLGIFCRKFCRHYPPSPNELLRKVEGETETCIAESLAKEILDEPDEPQPKRAMLSNLQDPRNLPRFPIKTWEKSVGTEQPECPMPSRQCQWHREKKSTMVQYGLLQKTVPENNHKTQCRCVCHVSLYLAWVHTGNTFQSLIVILGQYRCSSSPCRYRGAGCPHTRAGHSCRVGTALGSPHLPRLGTISCFPAILFMFVLNLLCPFCFACVWQHSPMLCDQSCIVLQSHTSSSQFQSRHH